MASPTPGIPARTAGRLGRDRRPLGERGGFLRLGAISGPYAGRVFTVADRLTVGRSAPCGLRLADPKVSRRHATLAVDNGTLTVRDEASLNGTWVNDRRIAGTAALRAGDRLRIGGSEFIVAGADGAEDAFPAELEELLAPVTGEAVLTGSGTFASTSAAGQSP